MRSTYLLVFIGILGCNAANPESQSATKASQTASTVAESPNSATTLGQNADLTQLNIEARRKVSEITLPVLIFGTPYDQDSMIMKGEVWYAISVNQPDLTLTLHASNKVHLTVKGEAAPYDTTVRGQGARITDNDGIRGVSWKENGTFYVVEAECHEASDTRCLKNDFVLSLANNMVRAK